MHYKIDPFLIEEVTNRYKFFEEEYRDSCNHLVYIRQCRIRCMFICSRSVIRWFRISCFKGGRRLGGIRFFRRLGITRRMLKKNKLLFYNRNSIDLMIILKFKGKLLDLVTAHLKSKKAISSGLSLWMGFRISIIKTMILPLSGRNYRICIRIIGLMKHSAFAKASKMPYFYMILTLNWMKRSMV